jgi:hypothetical protein
MVTTGKSYWYVEGNLHDIEREAGESVDHLEFFMAADCKWGKEIFSFTPQEMKALRESHEGLEKGATFSSDNRALQSALAKIDRKSPVQLRVFPDFVVMVLYGRLPSVHAAQDALIATCRHFPDDAAVALSLGGGWSSEDRCVRTTYGDLMSAESFRDISWI